MKSSQKRFSLRYDNVVRSGFCQHVHPFLFHFLSPGIKSGHPTHRQMPGEWNVSQKAILMGISWRSPTVNSHLYTFPLSTVDTEPLWLARLCTSAVPQKVCLVSNFLCLL